MNTTKWIAPLLACGTWLGCSTEPNAGDKVAVARAALSACDETVPDNRFIDGIPAYAQCADSENSAIYSNNGVDTSLTQVDSSWVRTQWSGGYQCTELAHRYLYFIWDVEWTPNGNAGTWCDSPPPASSGVVQTTEPVHGDVMVLAPGSCGASPSTGHLTVIDVADGSDRLSVVEQNGARRGSYQTSCAKCFLHVVANDGTGTGAAGAPAPGMDATGGSAAPVPMMPVQPMQPAPMTPPPVQPMQPAPMTPPPVQPMQPVPAQPMQPTSVPPAPAPTAAPVGTGGAPSLLPAAPTGRTNAHQDAAGCSVATHDAAASQAWGSMLLMTAALWPLARRRKPGR